MRFRIVCFFLLAAFMAAAQESIPSPADVHPEIFRILKDYPPLLKGGYRIERFGENRYIVLGIGRAALNNGFLRALKTAELDAELQIAKALQPALITVENLRSKTTETSSSGETESRVFREKFVKMLVSAQTPFIHSCGAWRNENTLFCARAVFVGEFEHRNRQAKLSSRVSGLRGREEMLRVAEDFSYLNSGGTLLFQCSGTALLLTVAVTPPGLPESRKLTFARNQAYRNLIAFVSGGKLEQQLTVLNEIFSSDKGELQARRSKRKELESTVKGEFQFIEPLARWRIFSGSADCFLYIVKLGTVQLVQKNADN